MEIEKVSGDYRPLILVAEDDDSNFKLIKAIIGKKCEILWAKNGEDIVNLFEENRDKAEAILMDIKMPIMNGLDATVIIRKKDKELPIIMQTAYAFTADRQALASIYELAQLLSSMTEIKKNMEEANLKIEFVKKKMEERKDNAQE